METSLGKNKQETGIFQKKMKVKRRKDSWHLYLMLLPAVIIIGTFSYGPMFGLVMAFQDYKPYLGIRGSEWIGLENFKYLFEYPQSREVIWNTLRFAFMKLFFSTLVTISFALLINELRVKWIRYPVQTMVFLPHFLSWVVLGGIFKEMLTPGTGIVNQFIERLGFESIFFLGENSWFVATVVATDVWKGFGYGSILYLASMAGINPALYEAAEMDGAGRWKKMWYVTIPELIPVIMLVTTINLAFMMSGDFDQIFNLYSPLVYEKGDIIDTFVYRVGLIDLNYGFAAAVGFFKSIVGTIMIITAFTVFTKLSGRKAR
ncbi:ABC transporter permease [Litchfieldia alkalitelluris]|uniref:ABC transporter permease n=1 Tax=Litchfieldia alkalitelluris TaxID=304268 RepID=UPI0009967426|nr:ABC transporter permease subunit [Litchfieldia alkalitelluris]